MTTSFQVLFGDDTAVQPAGDEFYDALDTLEVEENADLPGAMQLTMPVATRPQGGDEDLTVVDDDPFRPYSRVAVVVTVDGVGDSCIFDGYVLAHSVHLDSGTVGSRAQVWGQDMQWRMNLVEKIAERAGTDGQTANTIFGDYGFSKAAANLDDDGPDHQLDDHVIMQRGTDAQFLRDRARRAGRLFRVCCDDRPGQNTGYFVKPDLGAEPVTTLHLNPVEDANVDSLEFTWDVTRPTEVEASALVRSKDAVDGGARQSDTSLLDRRSLRAFAGDDHVMKARLTATVDGAGELRRRSQSLLREAGLFVRCEGEADIAGLGHVLRVGTVAEVSGAGRLHSGRYFVWRVQHVITAESHRMRFVLVRNAVGES